MEAGRSNLITRVVERIELAKRDGECRKKRRNVKFTIFVALIDYIKELSRTNREIIFHFEINRCYFVCW